MMKPIAHFEWHMPSRSLGWVNAWDPQNARYDDDYVSPKKWHVILDAGKSEAGGSDITRYRWEIQGLDQIKFAFVKEISVDTEIHDHTDQGEGDFVGPIVDKVLPSLGRYRVTLTVTNKNGEKSDPVSGMINLQDLLIVSIGDSMASGEGNPDKEKEDDKEPAWTDRRCHRSANSGHARAAFELEGPHRSVTFLSFACSGASLESGLIGTYDGMENPSGAHALPSQIDAVATAIGTANRTIDMLLITAGLNELGDNGFSSVIKTFALLHPFQTASDDMKELLTSQLPTMPDKFNGLAWELSRRLHGRVRQVFITEYPADIFQPSATFLGGVDRSGCGELALIDDGEGTFIFEKGKEFNQIIQRAAQLHGWSFVSGIEKAFNGHGYCNDPTFYVGREESISKQGNEDGTIHPNRSGQLAIRDCILETIRASTPDVRHPKRVTVVFETIKGIDPGNRPGTITLFADVFLGANGQEKSIGSISSHEIVLPEKDFSFTSFVDDGLAGPFVELVGHATERIEGAEDGDVKIRDIDFSRRFGPEEKFGEGHHVRNGPDLEVHYRISVTDELLESINWVEPVLHVMMR
jgi:hypothetical protein